MKIYIVHRATEEGKIVFAAYTRAELEDYIKQLDDLGVGDELKITCSIFIERDWSAGK